MRDDICQPRGGAHAAIEFTGVAACAILFGVVRFIEGPPKAQHSRGPPPARMRSADARPSFSLGHVRRDNYGEAFVPLTHTAVGSATGILEQILGSPLAEVGLDDPESPSAGASFLSCHAATFLQDTADIRE